MRILELATGDRGGGAERVALDLHRAYRARGHDARLLVKFRHTNEEGISEIDPYASTAPWSSLCAWLEGFVASRPWFRGQYRLRDWLRRTAWPQRWLDHVRGIEDFNYLVPLGDWQPDVIHAHNLHGDYFDLAALTVLSRQMPVVWTLHDCWALTGHCAYALDCTRWRTGCGNCPDLKRPPAIRCDRTAENWRRKREIYSQSELAIAVPSRWLMDLVGQSMLRPTETRLVPYGVDETIYHPADKHAARQVLGIAPEAFVCLFVTTTGQSGHPYKDYFTAHRAMELVVEEIGDAVQLVCLGGVARKSDDPRYRYPGRVSAEQVAAYCNAADVLLHAAHADNFPCTVLEALACGTPVIATAVGGIVDQVVDGETGFLVSHGDAGAMATCVLRLVHDRDLRRRMALAAGSYARERYSLTTQTDSYLAWFENAVRARRAGC